MKFLLSSLVVILCTAMVAGQFFPYGFQRFDYNAFGGGAPTNVRDPRQNRGPVVFPPAPRDSPVDESSGVIVGASGYGFVPPQQNAIYYSSLQTPDTSYASYNLYRNPYSYHYTFF